MKINNLIDREYISASVLEDMRDICVWLNDHQYLAIIDEELNIIGIVTLKDLHANPDSRAVIDCNIRKPIVGSNQTIIEVLNVMKESETDYLPVYENSLFVGIISLNNLIKNL